MKYCIHCGKEVLDDAIICPGCGCSVQKGSVSSLIGLILSIVAHSDAQRTGSLKSQTISKAGIIISAVILGLIAFFIIFWIIAMFAWFV